MIARLALGVQTQLNLSVAIVDGNGLRTDPLSATVTVWKVNQTIGNLDASGLGVVALAQQDGEVGLWGVVVNVSALTVGLYLVLFEVTTVLGVSVYSDTFQIDSPSSGEVGAPSITITAGNVAIAY